MKFHCRVSRNQVVDVAQRRIVQKLADLCPHARRELSLEVAQEKSEYLSLTLGNLDSGYSLSPRLAAQNARHGHVAI